MEGSSSPTTVGCEAKEEEEGDDLKSRERPPIVVEEDDDRGLRSRSQETLIWCGVEHTVLGGLA